MSNEVRAALAVLWVTSACTGWISEDSEVMVEPEPVGVAAVADRAPSRSVGGAPELSAAAGGTAGGSTAGGSTAGGSTAGGGAPAPLAFTPGATGCSAMLLEPGIDVGGYTSDRYSWRDADCRPRSAALVRNDAADPGGSYGGFLRELTWERSGQTIVARGTGVNTYNGWGYVVSHFASSSVSSKRSTGTYRTVLAGAHHAIHEFRVRLSPGGPVDATVQWFFATGRSHPVYFITYDATPAGPNVVTADSRAPYGDLAFEGSVTAIGGVAWGDKYRFTTTSGPVTAATAWDYSQPNVVPFVRMWSQSADAEMGSVQTESWAQKPAGGDYGAGRLATECWAKTSATAAGGCAGTGWTMPQSYLWPFQLNQYELPYTNTSHRVAWGSTYGAIGRTSYQAFGKTLSGYPTVSYSVFVAIGPKSPSAVMQQVTEVEHVLGAQVTGATWEPAFGVWHAAMSSGHATVSLVPAAGALESPIFRITGFTAPAVTRVSLDGQTVSQWFATVDPATQTLWLTLNGAVTGPVTLQVE